MAIQDNVNRLLGSVLGGVTSAKFINNQEKQMRTDNLKSKVALENSKAELQNVIKEEEDIASNLAESHSNKQMEVNKDLDKEDADIRSKMDALKSKIKQGRIDKKYFHSKGDIAKEDIAKKTLKELNIQKNQLNEKLKSNNDKRVLRLEELQPELKAETDRMMRSYLLKRGSLERSNAFNEFLASGKSVKDYKEAMNKINAPVKGEGYLQDLVIADEEIDELIAAHKKERGIE